MTTKMPSESPAVAAQTEKPPHYTYLKEFRTQQCPLFLQHKCTQHRPFTCFHWHFMNQRRRRPVRKRDGTFNYSPDIYCTKYDETSGMCPDGDDCPFLHRTAGDTERRYHLRYYKTGTCVYETDAKGHCMKNGPHCAFAHGAMDLRPPVYDVRELQTIDQTSDVSSSPGTPSSGSLEKDRLLIEDPRWNDTNFVLANYKTETCKRPPRLCRQGYACPQYHNNRDRRRSPKLNKYRSTPCPNVKHGDDWGDPAQCENGDNCGYCHTRTEQQFHPEIYKSTKCNDMVQTNYCPRGPFCAFAHVEQEITTQRDIASQGSSFLAAMISNLLPTVSSVHMSLPTTTTFGMSGHTETQVLPTTMSHWTMPETTTNGIGSHSYSGSRMPDPVGKERTNSTSSNSVVLNQSLSSFSSLNNNNHHQSMSPLPEPIGKGRSCSMSSSVTSNDGSIFYHRAPGSERDDIHQQMKLRQQLQAIDNDSTLDTAEKLKRKQNLMLVHNLNMAGGSLANLTSSSLPATSMSPHAPAFYPPRDTVGSVIEQGLEDITLDDIDINSLDKELDNDTNSLSSSISAGISSSGFGSSSIPIGIPPCNIPRGSIGSLSQSPTSPYGSFQHSLLPMQSQKDSHSELYLGGHNHIKFSGSPFGDLCSMSPRSGPGGPHSPLYSQNLSNSLNSSSGSAELQKMQSDIVTYKTKLEHWEQAYNQAKAACEAWKKEAEESMRKMKCMEEEKMNLLKQSVELKHGIKSGVGHRIPSGEIDAMMLPQLRQIQQQLRTDLEKVEQVIYSKSVVKCVLCQENNRSISTTPCNHCVMCAKCAPTKTECPTCRQHIAQRVPTSNFTPGC